MGPADEDKFEKLSDEERELAEEIKTMVDPMPKEDELDDAKFLQILKSTKVLQSLDEKTYCKVKQILIRKTMVPKNNTFVKVKTAEDRKMSDRPKLKFDRVSGYKSYNLVQMKGAETMVFAQIVEYNLLENANIRQLVPARIPDEDERWAGRPIEGKLESLPEGTKSVAYLVFKQVSPETG